MKKTSLLFSLALIFAGFLLSSCKKDIEVTTLATNTLVSNDQTVNLISASQKYDRVICVEGCIGMNFSIVAQDGSKIYFGIFCNPDARTIESGIYNLNTSSYFAEYRLGDFWMSMGDANFTTGSLTITKSGETYTVNFSGVQAGKEVKGNYTGLIPFSE